MANSKQELSSSLFSNIKGDVFGGLTAGIVALPLALAFGVQSGLGAPAGLFGAIFIGFFAALVGGTPTQISGPTAPMTALSMVVVAGIVQANDGVLADALPAILMVFFLTGVFQVLFGLVRLGTLIKYIPYPVVSGFMSGIGVIILITQLLPLFGYSPVSDQANIEHFKPAAEEVLLDKILKDEAGEGLLVLEDFRETVRRAELISNEQIILEAKALAASDAAGVMGSLRYLPKAIQNINHLEFLLALLTILIIYGFKRITKAVPSTLVALVVVTLISVFASLQITTIGNIPRGFPTFYASVFTDFSFASIAPYILTALSLALLGAIDSLLTSVVADNMTKTRHKPDKELIGQGIGNSVAALFGGIPGAGATIRTVVNIDAGGKTRLSGMVAAILLLVILLALGPLAELIPKAVLAGILITVGFGVMDYKGLRALRSMPISDAVVLLIVLVLTVFVDLILAVGVGLVLSSLLFMKEMADISSKASGLSSLDDAFEVDDQMDIPTAYSDEVVLKRLSGPLFFGNTSDFRLLAAKIPASASAVLIDMAKVPYMDKSGLNALDDVIIRLIQSGKKVILIGVAEQPMYMLESIDLVPELVARDLIFKNMEACAAWIRVNVADDFTAPQTQF